MIRACPARRLQRTLVSLKDANCLADSVAFVVLKLLLWLYCRRKLLSGGRDRRVHDGSNKRNRQTRASTLLVGARALIIMWAVGVSQPSRPGSLICSEGKDE
jgi:hypothetical protein